MKIQAIPARASGLLGAIALMFAAVQPTNAAVFRDGWQYAIDPGYDSYGSVNGVIKAGGTIYETYGIAIHEDADNNIWVALNTDMPITGNPTGPELCLNDGPCFPVENDSIAWGDLFLDFSGTGNFKQAFDTNKLFGVRFAPNNDSRTPDGSRLETGVYQVTAGANVAGQNAGFQNLEQNRRFLKDPTLGNIGDLEPWMGDLAWDNPYYAPYTSRGSWSDPQTLMPNIIATGNRLGDVTIRSQAELQTQGFKTDWFFQTGANIFGFSFKKTAEMAGDFIASLLQECINEGVALIGTVSPPTPTPAPPPAPLLCDIAFRQNQDYLLRPTRTEGVNGEIKVFENTLSNQWYDPDPSMGYNVKGTGDTLISEILNFPCLPNPSKTPYKFDVIVGNITLGNFSPGNPLDFSQYEDKLGNLLIEDPITKKLGVKEFKITGFEKESWEFFQKIGVNTRFTREIGSIEVTPISSRSVPEPNSIISFLIVGVTALSVKLWRRPKL
ncbi:XDD3 family exosortase-dependent surface protein [Oscillatoria sp. FACHB-1406]|uniref:XDD3 family exosortase-dependent surface protein n=1 Tax=Oscillatoria sp. FACHB-1406 TaxID=2692846 RepID=UPI0016856BD0|nr:XDD3 family exosortase-dependent surface protein [Oscillatoria sp. FACHB-1406]MBD2578364.1 hypothetical protein [Oscillatoria sp. FACHB-1406]